MRRKVNEIRKQELWTRKVLVPFIQECYGDEWDVTSGRVEDNFDIKAINHRLNVMVLLEAKEWSQVPENYRNLIIKEEKILRMWHAGQTMFLPDEGIDMKVKLAFLVFCTGNTSAYIVSLDNADDKYEKHNMKQPVCEYATNPDFRYYQTFFIPVEQFHKADIKPYLDLFGYNRNQMRN